ncbi:hypothetical protein ZHAS_00010162 [Anopheles sinensis]|uniref:Uncharacterized protein n=1 Tax=Anopheles sinensis TaxID=74873 RepID=A0A084VWS2_ANOSI|nr:hypothetical protein ZHAS_00010162 [Anopheles sinensis]
MVPGSGAGGSSSSSNGNDELHKQGQALPALQRCVSAFYETSLAGIYVARRIH